ncbi:BA3454 family stress response protein [Bacillus sp. UNC41MFS5]
MNTKIEVPVTLYFKGRNYQTNVFARKDTPETQIFQKE